MRSPRSHWFVVCILALTAAFFPHWAVTQSQPTTPQQSDTTAKSKADQNKVTCADNATYVNSKGQSVKRPENCSAAPQGATAQCRDGTYSFSQSRRGTCSHHGGVEKWL
jgi:hypothetical protein